jgi:hypothetical protein
VKGSIDSYDALVVLLDSIEHFLNRLDIYTKTPPTVAMTEMVVKILVELLSTLALATKQINQGKIREPVLSGVLCYLIQCNAVKLIKKPFGEKEVEAVLQRLDRLTLEEARLTSAQTFEVVSGLFQNMRVVMDGEQVHQFVACWVLRIFPSRRQGIGRPSKGCARYVFWHNRVTSCLTGHKKLCSNSRVA